jgi:hypothetical protein
MYAQRSLERREALARVQREKEQHELEKRVCRYSLCQS